MKTYQKFTKPLISMMGLVLILFLVQCSKNVGPIDRDDLVLPDGDRALVIKTMNSKAGEALGTYQLEIQGPSGTETVSPTGDTHTLTTLVNGLYTITSSKDGFIGQTIEFAVELPADRTSDYSAEVELLLTKLNPPVVVDNATGGEVEAPPIGDGSGGTGSNTATLTIPANAIAETGTTSISFTQIPPEENVGGVATLKSTDFGIATTGFILSPADLYFNTPGTINFAIAFSPKFLNMGIGARMYLFENGVATSTYVEVEISADGQTGTVDIPKTGTWKLIEGWEVEFVESTVSKLFTSGCGEDLSARYQLSGSYGPEYIARLHIRYPTATISKEISKNGSPWYTTSVEIKFGTKNYVMRNKANGASIETRAAIPNGRSWKTYSSAPCHDSGGHDSGGN